jgi:hypothetical protein
MDEKEKWRSVINGRCTGEKRETSQTIKWGDKSLPTLIFNSDPNNIEKAPEARS